MAWKYMIVDYPLAKAVEEAASKEVDVFKPRVLESGDKAIVKFWAEEDGEYDEIKEVDVPEKKKKMVQDEEGNQKEVEYIEYVKEMKSVKVRRRVERKKPRGFGAGKARSKEELRVELKKSGELDKKRR